MVLLKIHLQQKAVLLLSNEKSSNFLKCKEIYSILSIIRGISMSLFSNKQMRIIFIYCVIIILVICGIITARHKKTSSDSIVKTTKTNNETSESSDTQHTSDNTPNTDRLPPYNSSNQGNGIGGGAIMGNCSIGSRKLPIYCVDLSKKN